MNRQDFHQATRGVPPHPSLLQALEHWHGVPGQALDLGCGSGRDTHELLRQGWRVLAIDSNAAGLRHLTEGLSTGQAERLQTRCERFQDTALPNAQLINSSFALPFCPPADFPRLWQSIEAALQRGGLFAGHFFGERDQWQGRDGMSFHTREAAQALFQGWETLRFEEHEWQGKTAVGGAKHWHIFTVVARRP